MNRCVRCCLRCKIAIRKHFKRIAKKKEAELRANREELLKYLAQPFAPELIESFNITLIMNSAGWIGGNYSETELKQTMLFNKRKWFTDEEYNELRAALGNWTHFVEVASRILGRNVFDGEKT